MKSTSFAKICLSGISALLMSAGSVYAASCDADDLCFWDFEQNNRLGTVDASNLNWTDFGWNDRADKFKNRGTTHNACVYEDINFSGSDHLILRGRIFEPLAVNPFNVSQDDVSSNLWIRSGDCD